MTETIEAVFDGAVLRPISTLQLKPNTRVRLTVETLPVVDDPNDPPNSFLKTARDLNLNGPADWSANLDEYLYGDDDPSER